MSSDEEKYALRKNTIKYKKALEQELDKWFGSARNAIRNALIIGGTLTVSYMLVKKLTKVSKSKKKKIVKRDSLAEQDSEPSLFDEISNQILRELSVFILMYAKQKILEYIETLKDNDE